MKKTKMILSFCLVVITMISSLQFNVFALSNSDIKELEKDGQLEELWQMGKDSYKLISNDGVNYVSQFTIDSTLYQIEEVISNNRVESNFYKLENNDKYFLGILETKIDKGNNGNIIVSLSENDKTIDIQNMNSKLNDDAIDVNSVVQLYASKAAKVEYKWHHLCTNKGSNAIYKYTVGAIVAILGTAAGSTAAVGLTAVANYVISDHWQTVWWICDQYAYNQRCKSWPSYPNWISAGKYRYVTKYYSNSKRTNYIGTSKYTNG